MFQLFPSPDTFISCAHPPSSISPQSGACLRRAEDNSNTCALISAYEALQSAWAQDSATRPRVKAFLQGRSLRYRSSAKEAALTLQSSSFKTKASKPTFHVNNIGHFWIIIHFLFKSWTWFMECEFWETPMWLSSTDSPQASKIMKNVKDSGKTDPNS